MDLSRRYDAAIARALASASGAPGPGKLSRALLDAVLPGGARIRPTILLSVAAACGDDAPDLADAGAAALEFIHCASLVHDDLPCFDDASQRRGKPTTHAAFGEPIAVLTGDSLIVLGFETLSRARAADHGRIVQMIMTLATRTGTPFGICAGQGWESETSVDLTAYHRAKTGALFVAATQMGAISAGHDPEPWEELGLRIGEAFQVADDLRDAIETSDTLGKPAGQDAAHGRPSAVAEYGIAGARERLKDILSGAIASIPSCPGEAPLAAMVQAQASRFSPSDRRRAVPGE